MRALPALLALALSAVASTAAAAEYTCTCVADNCTIGDASRNNAWTRNVPRNFVQGRMSRVVGQVSGGGSIVIFYSPADAPMGAFRFVDDGKFRCVEEQASTTTTTTTTTSSSSSSQMDVTTVDQYGRQPLQNAAAENDLVRVRDLLKAGADVNHVDGQGDTAFSLAIKNRNKPIASLLLDAGANPNASSPRGIPIESVVSAGDADLLGLLLDKGAKPTSKSVTDAAQARRLELLEPQLAKGGDAQAALLVLVGAQDEALVETVLNRGVRPSDEVVRKAIGTGNTSLLETILQHGGSAQIVLDEAMNKGDVALANLALARGAKAGSWLAKSVEMGDPTLVRGMLAAGGNPNDGMWPAVRESKDDLVVMLLDAGASASAPALISHAAGAADMPIVNLLLDRGANANDGMKSAIEAGQTSVVQILIGRGANGAEGSFMVAAAGAGKPDIVDLLLRNGGDAETGMQPGCAGGSTEVVVRLISAGGDPTRRECMVSAVEKGHAPMVTLLLQNGGHVDWTVGKQQETLLHVAAKDRSYDIVKVLLEGGADVAKADNTGETPLHAAGRTLDNVSVMSLLIEAGADVNAVDNKGRSVFKVSNGPKNRKYLKDQGAEK